MKLTLYHYIHCPYCVRVRLALGFLQLPWTSQVLPYHDEATPITLTGKKMLPIMEIDGRAMNESREIIQRLDVNNLLQNDLWQDMDMTLGLLADKIHNLAMPYWVWMPEFSAESRLYFVTKKSSKRGPFSVLAQRRSEFEIPLQAQLSLLESELTPFWQSQQLSIRDIALAAHLWGLFVVPEFRFSQKWYDYLMKVKELCRFDYYQQHWGTA